MTLDEIITLGKMGYSKADIAALTAPTTPVARPIAPTTPVAQPIAPTIPVAQPTAPVAQPTAPTTLVAQSIAPTTPVAQPTAPTTPVAQPTAPTTPVAQPTAPATPFVDYLQTLGAAASGQIAPASVAANLGISAGVAPVATPTPSAPAAPSAGTPLTVEQATQLFQQYTLNGVANGVDLPPNVDDVLAARFNSLYGVDTSKNNGGKQNG